MTQVGKEFKNIKIMKKNIASHRKANTELRALNGFVKPRKFERRIFKLVVNSN